MELTRAYLHSETVNVTLCQTGAQVRANFTFRFDPDRLDYLKAAGGVIVEFPMWLPDNDPQNPAVADFWKVFGARFQHVLDERSRECLEDTLHFSARLRSHFVQFGIRSRSSHLDDPGAWRLSKLELQRPEFVTFQADGAACMVALLRCEAVDLRDDAPLAVTYRQPLVKSADDHRYVYLPSFYGLPPGASTSDTNRYAIVLSAARDCSLRVSNGREQHDVPPGHDVVLSPRHLQPIRAIVVPQPK